MNDTVFQSTSRINAFEFTRELYDDLRGQSESAPPDALLTSDLLPDWVPPVRKLGPIPHSLLEPSVSLTFSTRGGIPNREHHPGYIAWESRGRHYCCEIGMYICKRDDGHIFALTERGLNKGYRKVDTEGIQKDQRAARAAKWALER